MSNTITKISVQKHHRHRFNIYLDNQYSFAVSEATLIKYQLIKGMALPINLLDKIQASDEFYRYYNKAITFLSYQPRTIYEVKQRLKEESYKKDTLNQLTSDDVIDKVLDKLAKLNLLDDKNYANSYVKDATLQSKKGPIKIKQYLSKKGVAPDLIQQALNKYYGQEEELKHCNDEVLRLSKQYRNYPYRQVQQKMTTNLLSKGYALDIIKEAILTNEASIKANLVDTDFLIKRLGEKLWYKYRNLPDYKRTFKTKSALYRKGFTSEEINVFMDNIN